MKEKKTRTWSHRGKPARGKRPKPFFLKNILLKLAKEHDLKLKLNPEFETHSYPYVLQTEESDLHFLTRLAKELDGLAKPAHGFLLFVKKGAGKSDSGKILEAVVFNPSHIKSWRVTLADRGKYQSVQDCYHNPTQVVEWRVTVGSEKPVNCLSIIYRDENEAMQVAKSKLATFHLGKSKLSLELIGNANLFPERPLLLKHFRTGVHGLWRIHSLTQHRAFKLLCRRRSCLKSQARIQIDGSLPKKYRLFIFHFRRIELCKRNKC